MAKVSKQVGKLFIESATNPRQGSGDFITLTVSFKDIGVVEFTANPNDSEEHGRYLYEQAKAGKYGKIKACVTPEPTIRDLQQKLNPLLTDITLGIATEEEIALARELRLKIKELEAEAKEGA